MHRTSFKSFITPNLWSIIAIALVFTSTIAARSNANAAPTLASPQPPGVEYLGNVGGSIKAIATNGNYILLLEGNFVKSLRLETDGSMTVLAKRDIGNGSAIHLVGTRAYVQTDTSVVVIDWSNPTAIPILGTYAQNNLIATAAVGTSLYLLYYISSDNYDNGVDTVLAVLDATNPAAVTVQGSTTFTTYEVYGFIVHNQRAYVLFASSQVSLATYDVASPTSPTLLGTSILDLGNNIHPPRSLVNMAVTGTMLYMVIEGSAALIGFDISNPASIIQRDSLTINDSYTPHITIHNTRAYVTNSVWPYMSDFPSHYLDIYDLTDPTTLPHLGRYRLSTDAHDIVVDGTRAYVALTRGVQVVDISNPAELTITHQLKTMGPVSRIVPHSDKVYTLGEQVAQIDISNPL